MISPNLIIADKLGPGRKKSFKELNKANSLFSIFFNSL